MLLILQQPVYVRGLCEVRVRLYACMLSTSRVFLCSFLEKKKYSSEENKEHWYGRPESILAQTLAETQKKGNKTNF
jgi:hypothetical protein